MQKLILTTLSESELINLIREAIHQELKEHFDKKEKLPQYMTPKEVEAKLRISRTTRYRLRAVLKPVRIGGKTMYIRAIIDNAPLDIE